MYSQIQHKTHIDFRNLSKASQFKHKSLPRQLYKHTATFNKYQGKQTQLSQLKQSVSKYLQKDLQRNQSINEFREKQNNEKAKVMQRKIIRDYFHRIHRQNKTKNIVDNKVNMTMQKQPNNTNTNQNYTEKLKDILFRKRNQIMSVKDKMTQMTNRSSYDIFERKYIHDKLSISLNLTAKMGQCTTKIYNPQSYKQQNVFSCKNQSRKSRVRDKMLEKIKLIDIESVEPWNLNLKQQYLNDFYQ